MKIPVKAFSSIAYKLDPKIMQAKFRGSLLGGLVGDCCGAPFEGELLGAGDRVTLHKYFDKLEGPYFAAPAKAFTDDTAMTKSVARCLIAHKDLPNKELAEYFIREYYRDPNRGYGAAIGEVFFKLRKNKLSDVLGPAKEQFNGKGSFGNGAAMRVAPVGLFCYNHPEKLEDLIRKSAEVTHSHFLGVRGALLQGIAVNLCVRQDPEKFDKNAFIDEILDKFKVIEKDEEGLGLNVDTSYQVQLAHVKKLLRPESTASDDEILNFLGHSVAALFSVPTAVFCFLKCLDDIKEVKATNVFRRTIEYAISLGGDTDTIASMAGSLTGALYGDSVISPNIVKHCESSDEIIKIADELYEAAEKI